ncbi:hypothetical protein [Rhizobium sp. Root1220]|uniref:hypothetical protein n=1 Tax=Rhizobium sp. Root1220 TaxID=1736432 RepID=UPI0006FC0B72|nr:hypothetical protein [Rhizobium sp. Root1220]KQV68399.1 hypothetical protein ASC90_12370 [Rhizobium sp. Root1220]
MRHDARRMTGRVAVSLAVAIFAYLGLLFGGNLVLGPARGPNSLSSSSKDGQPLQISVRDAVRGILAADRKVTPKHRPYDSGDAAIFSAPPAEFAPGDGVRLVSPIHATLRTQDAKPYDAHGPPTSAA